MAIGWFIVPYKRRTKRRRPTRYCAMDDYTSQIRAHGGMWAESEVLGNRAIVKVRAPVAVLAALNDVPGFKRIPKDRLDDSLADLSQTVRAYLRDEILDMGYTIEELRERFGNDLGAYTLRDVLKFMARRRRKPRYNPATDEIILDGEIQECREIENLDAAVTED